jgi:hypothetical protein
LIDPSTMPFLPVAAGNQLTLVDSKHEQRKGMDNEDYFYDEVNRDGVVVAKYHVWHHMNTYPPQQVNEGWKKFDLAGKVLCEGKSESR